MLYTADFETTTDINDCRVWACGICEIKKPYKFYYGNSLTWFLKFLKEHTGDTFYFHNLKFDGEFIMSALFKMGFVHVKKKAKDLNKMEFSTLISDKGMHYNITLCLGYDEIGNPLIVKIYDSLKILPFSVDAVAKGFGLPISKLELDYSAKREVGHILTEHEIEYLRHDVEIMARALEVLFEQGLNKMTQGSNALYDYKRIVGKKNFNKWFPIPDYDADVRAAYKGGFTYCDSRTQGKDIGEGIVFDVNSLYPSVMYYQPLPYGEGVYFDGKYKDDKLYNLYVQMFTCQFELKDGYIPTVQVKQGGSPFIPTEYLSSSKGEDVTLCMTNIDLEIFKEHYHIYNMVYHSGWKFKSTTGLFRDYIDKWNKIKMESTLNGNTAMRTLAKLMMNALYGKFALNPKVQSKIPYLGDDEIIHYRYDEPETRNPIYIPMGVFITAWARHKTITSAQKVYPRFLYADTDSLHLSGTEIPENLEVDPVKLGAWKHESTFTRARFVRQKTYVEEINGKLNITCAGMPARCHQHVTWDNFKSGSRYKGALKMVHTKGGIVLIDNEFTMKHY